MAAWQFKVALIPKPWLDAGGLIAALVTETGWETASAWAGVRDDSLKARIERVLPRGKSWSPALSVWGSEDRNDIQLFEAGGFVESLNVRFDLREPDMELFKSIFAFAQESELAVVDMMRKRIVPDLDGFVRAAAESEAAHFVRDPTSFFEQVKTSARAT